MTLPPSPTPLVSVILPTHNGALRIRAAIDSVVNQTVDGGVELLVVDDASTDDTVPVVLALRIPRLRLFRLLSNAGPYAARNLAIRSARGKFVAFIDDDDEWLPGKLRRQLQAFEDDPELALVHGGMIDVFTSGHRRLRLPPRGANTYSGNLWHDCIGTSTVIVRRAALETVGGFDETMRAMGDWDLWTRIARTQKLAAIYEPLAIIHLRAGSIQRGPVPHFAHWHRVALDKRFPELDRLGLVSRAEAAHHYAIAAKLHDQSCNSQARSHLRASLRARPSTSAVALLLLTLLPRRVAFQGRLFLRRLRTYVRA